MSNPITFRPTERDLKNLDAVAFNNGGLTNSDAIRLALEREAHRAESYVRFVKMTPPPEFAAMRKTLEADRQFFEHAYKAGFPYVGDGASAEEKASAAQHRKKIEEAYRRIDEHTDALHTFILFNAGVAGLSPGVLVTHANYLQKTINKDAVKLKDPNLAPADRKNFAQLLGHWRQMLQLIISCGFQPTVKDTTKID